MLIGKPDSLDVPWSCRVHNLDIKIIQELGHVLEQFNLHPAIQSMLVHGSQ
jgi:hypothetical protein